jgi:hypothetical protein
MRLHEDRGIPGFLQREQSVFNRAFRIAPLRETPGARNMRGG